MAFRANSFEFLWRTVNSKPPTMPFGIVACTFSDNLSRNSCICSSNWITPKTAHAQLVDYLRVGRSMFCYAILITRIPWVHVRVHCATRSHQVSWAHARLPRTESLQKYNLFLYLCLYFYVLTAILNFSYKFFKSFVISKTGVETRGNLRTELGPPVFFSAIFCWRIKA